MSLHKANNNRNNIIDLDDLFRKIIFHWPLYLIVVALAVSAGLLYLRYKQPIYMSSARLYLKDEKKGGGSDEMDALKSLSLFNSGKNMENEMEVLQSPILLEKVISNNSFNIRYYIKRSIRNEEKYGNAPLELHAVSGNPTVGNYIFHITMKDARLDIKAMPGNTDSTIKLSIAAGTPFGIGKDTFVINTRPDIRLAATDMVEIKVDSVIEMAYKVAEDISAALVNRDATVVMVTYKDPVAERTADFLNALLNNYNEYTLNDKNKVAIKTIQFLTTRIDSLKEELGLLERQEETFKVQRGITDIDAGSKLALEQVKEADIHLNEANLQLSVVDQVENYINNPASGYPFAPVTTSVDQTLTSMINRYEESLREKKRLSLSLLPTSEIMQNLDGQINDAKNTIKNYINGYRRNAGIVQQKTQAKVNEIQGKIANIPAYAREYINIKRQQGVKENLYLYLLKKKEEAAVTYAGNVTDNKIIAPAFIPDKPISPKKPFIFISFIAIAVVAASVYVYVKYFLNPRILSRKEIEQVFDLPVIAEIYQQTEGLADFSLSNKSVLTEQIFNLRTNLKFLLSDHKGPSTIMLTSSLSGEGKTFLSAHLANSLTVSNKKVVLVEMDLRKPKLSGFLGMDYRTGITNYIVGNKTVDEIIRPVPGTEGLFLVSSGSIPPNPIEMIEGQRMLALLNILKEKFDYVIIDTSPVGIVSDAKSIAPYTDCTLFVVRYNFTLKSKLLMVAESLNGGLFRKKGIIFNGIEQDSFYPYYYYDQYSYDSNNARKNTWISIVKKTARRIA